MLPGESTLHNSDRFLKAEWATGTQAQRQALRSSEANAQALLKQVHGANYVAPGDDDGIAIDSPVTVTHNHAAPPAPKSNPLVPIAAATILGGSILGATYLATQPKPAQPTTTTPTAPDKPSNPTQPAGDIGGYDLRIGPGTK